MRLSESPGSKDERVIRLGQLRLIVTVCHLESFSSSSTSIRIRAGHRLRTAFSKLWVSVTTDDGQPEQDPCIRTWTTPPWMPVTSISPP